MNKVFSLPRSFLWKEIQRHTTPTLSSLSLTAYSHRFVRQYHRSSMSSLGITDRITDMFRTKMLEKKERNFQTLLELMLDTPKWNMKIWKVILEEQANQWQMKIPGVGGMDQAKELKKFLAIMNAMTEEELNHPEKIRAPQREKIALKAQATPEEVATLIHGFRQTLVTCEWLKFKKARGETLPTSEHELASMQSFDGRLNTIAAKTWDPEGTRHKLTRKRKVF